VAAGGYPYEVIVGSGTYDQFFGTVGIPSWNTKRELKTGDLIHFDSWGPFEDYYVDICRSSVVGGKPSDAQRDLMEGVIELIAKIVAEIRPGASLLKLFEVGTTWLDENGFGSYSDTNFADVFPSFGHGLGLGVERPWITEERPWVDRNSDNRIQEGMVLAVEAALDKPGLGIAGFEQNVIVTTSGVDVYTQICPSRWWA
jgi:Xaa-Pro aminopeptidase